MAVKKVRKSLNAETASKKPARLVKRLDQAEMRKMEECSSTLSYTGSQKNLYDQYAANIALKREKLLGDIKLLDHELVRARELQKREEEKANTALQKLQTICNELKLKYEIKSTGQIKYDSMTGEIIDK